MRDNSLPVPPPVETPLNWRRDRTPEAEARARYMSRARIPEVLDRHKDSSGIVKLLALGEACPFVRWWEREIWLEEIARISAERGSA